MKKENGFTLVELIVAIIVVAFVSVGIITLTMLVNGNFKNPK